VADYDLQRLECLALRQELPDPPINQDQARQCFFLFLQPAVAPSDGFAHTGEVIVLGARAIAAFFAADENLR